MSAKTAAKPASKSAESKTAEKPLGAGLGLEGLGDLPPRLDDPAAHPAVSGGPLELPLHLIHEDKNQPRKADNPGFSEESLGELAATIRARGVKSPISVRKHPKVENHYLINHGARRYRASKLAGKETIPAFVDNDYSEADQVIENLQRDDLTAREIADFIGRELARGKRKGDIAREIGKSSAFVTQHVTLLDLPESIAEAFNTGRAKDVTVINELVTAYKKDPLEVVAWLADDSQELTRGAVKLLREYLDDKRQRYGEDEADDDAPGPQDDDAQRKKKPKEPDPDQLKKAILQVKHDDRLARLILNRRPRAEGWAWLKYEDDGQEFEADLGTVQLVALLEG